MEHYTDLNDHIDIDYTQGFQNGVIKLKKHTQDIIDNAWFNFESSNKYKALCKLYANGKKDQDDIILAFLKTIPDELGDDLIYYHNMVLNWHTTDENESFYYQAIENLTEDLIYKELL